MVKFTFKPFKGPWGSSAEPEEHATTETPQNPRQRRREQVRRAQKTHRQRKETYVKSLESEVLQLRANEIRLYRETKTLYAEISALKSFIAGNGMRMPPAWPMPSAPAHNDQDQMATALADGFEFNIPDRTTKKNNERAPLRTLADHGGAMRPQISAPTTLDPFSHPMETTVSSQDSTSVAIDFILSLEAPCLEHIIAAKDKEQPSGHALLLSSTVLYHQQFTLDDDDKTASPLGAASESGVDRLLALSKSILLDGEVTPVQAWDYIRHDAHYHRLYRTRLEKLKALLLPHVKCHGFGGVISQDALEDAMFSVFAEDRFS